MIVTVSAYTRTPDNNVFENSHALSLLALQRYVQPKLELGPGVLERVEVVLRAPCDTREIALVSAAFSMAGVRVFPVHPIYGWLDLAYLQRGALTDATTDGDRYCGWSRWQWKSPAGIARDQRRQMPLGMFFDYADDDTVHKHKVSA